MKVYLDRNHCPVRQAGCESCFGGRIELVFTGKAKSDDLFITGCVIELKETEILDEITFYMKDRDGKDKVLVVNTENWPDAYNSWMDLYEKQQVNGLVGDAF